MRIRTETLVQKPLISVSKEICTSYRGLLNTSGGEGERRGSVGIWDWHKKKYIRVISLPRKRWIYNLKDILKKRRYNTAERLAWPWNES